ncbi:kinase-like domain-containing protein [Gigaspora rosea]|uniref:Kinase-like domain-containing protein n=1 Tax=Gigaspora rosea TaxID=44941 RepID=A0A397VZU9_9GLOM|nr:kinase-like domain-containing protein [Gigaspora rosea]
MIEWIPFDRLINLQKIKEDESEITFMATWLDGRRIIKGELLEYTQSRIKSCGVNLKVWHGSQACDVFIKSFTNYMQSKGNVVYGITQNKATNQYIMILPDEFSSRRNNLNGKCMYCEHYNTSPAWCQSCDPWKAIQEWTSGNNEIDNFIKEFQFKTTEYEKVIEWIPFDKLINLQKINEVSDLIFMATWVKGIRTIKDDSGKFQSRIISSVDLMKLNYSLTNALEFLENFEIHMRSEKYRIHGITQNPGTGQYMIVVDFYSDRRKSINGICEHCKRYNTNPAWCQLCDPPKMAQKTSGDKNIDDCIKKFQFKATSFEKVIEWIQFDNLENIKIIGKGGFGTVYSAFWLDGKRMVAGDNNVGYVRFRKKSCKVALKTLPGSQISSNFLNEFKNHMQCRLEGSELEVYGLTQDIKSGQYMMVYQYANRGNLHNFLANYFRELVWQKKLKQLADISYNLSQIHRTGLIHSDFHSGNILLNQNVDGNIVSYITDLGLSRQKDEYASKEGIYGVIPYVAPEVLKGQKYTQETDIYSLGVIMTEISTGKRPYEGLELDNELALAICKGLRPKFANGTPDCYVKLANQCMDSNPQNRPTAEYIYLKINQWKTIMESENLTDEEELDIKKKFINADSIIKKTLLESLSSFQNKYYSTLIDVQEIRRSLKVSIQYSSSISKQFASLPFEAPSNIIDLSIKDGKFQKN